MSREEESTGKERRAARRLNTRRRILDTAMDILVREGHEGFTIVRLASELDYAVGALYRYFKGKDAIIAALQYRIVTSIEADVMATFRALPERTRQHALARVFAAGLVYESLTRRRPMEHHVLSLSLGDPRPQLEQAEAESVLPALGSLLGHLGEVIADATEMGALGAGDASQRALVIWGSTYGMMALRKLERVRADIVDSRHTEELHMALIVGWGGVAAEAKAAFAEAATTAERVLSEPREIPSSD
ncbi:MAG: TetR/AcrR family transcriptional regulator [Polyangiales bacterium]